MMRPPKPADPVDLANVVTRRKALYDAGLTDRHIAALVRSGALVRIRRGEYVDGDLWSALDRADRHRLLTRAVMLTGHAGTTATHISSAVEHGAPTWDLPLDVVHTTRRDGKAGRRRSDWVQHRGDLPASDVVMRNGVPVSSAARACVEITTIADVEHSLVVVNGLLNVGATSVDKVKEWAATARHWPYSLTTDLVLRLCDPRIESAGESRFAYMCFRHHLPRPTPQVEVYDEGGRLVGRVDFAWKEYGVFVEFDGREKYTRFRKKGETLEEFLMREKKRQELICLLTGWVCIRITWADLAAPELLARRIRKQLESRSVRPA